MGPTSTLEGGLAHFTDVSEPRGGPRAPRGIRLAFAAALVCWAAIASVFVALPADSTGRDVAASVVYWGGAAFATVAFGRATLASGGQERLFWAMLGGGLVFRLAGFLSWLWLRGVMESSDNLVAQGLYLVSYLLLLGALLCGMRIATRGMTWVIALDTLSVMLSVGVLAHYFVLSSPGAGIEDWRDVVVVLARPAFDSVLLFLGLVMLSAESGQPAARLLTFGFLSFVVADVIYLAGQSGEMYEIGSPPEMFWALGLILLGLAALRAVRVNLARGRRIDPWRVFAFWLGPLSPPIHLAVVLVWGATHPPLPAYAAACGAVLFLYLALRVALVSFVTRRLGNEQEETARKLEESRVLYELHDTVKQGAHGVSLALRSALEADRRGDRDAARGLLERALKASRETEYQVSKPYDELQLRDGGSMTRPGDYVRYRLGKFEEYFGIKTHEDFKVPLESLRPAELGAFNRISIEAGWNVAKHSGARNMYLESRKIGDVSLFRIRDDGRGFDPKDPPPSLGLDYMRRRAAEAGAELDVISAPSRGTTVQLRFRAR